MGTMTFLEITTVDDFKSKVDTGDLTIVNVVATFYGREIPPCDQIAGKFDDLKTAKNLGSCQFLKVNTDTEDSNELTKYLDIPAGVESVFPLVKVFKEKEVEAKVEEIIGEKLTFPPSLVKVLEDLKSF